jgi:hypothetical protein
MTYVLALSGHKVQLWLLFSGKQRLHGLFACPADLQFDSQCDLVKHKLHVILTETKPKCMERNRAKHSQIKKANTKTRNFQGSEDHVFGE